MKRVTYISISLAAIGAAAYLLFPNSQDPAKNLPRAGAAPVRAVAPLTPGGGDAVYWLTASNTSLGFSAGKTVAGKTLSVSGGWSGKFGSQLHGNVIVDRKTLEIRQAQLEVEVGSLWSEHDLLTKNLKTCGFFNIAKYPTATFITTRVSRPASGAADSPWLIEGNFRLNGIEKSLQFPADVQVTPLSVRLMSRFSINRRDFDVIFRDNSAFPILDDSNIHPDVALKVTVECGLPPAPVSAQAPAATNVEPATAKGGLPPRFHQVIPFSQIGFDMVLVPGDAGKGINPFYMGRTEVTWDEFLPWSACKDIPEESAQAEQRAFKQRPSVPYITLDRGFGYDHRPALGMSRLAADVYCQWLGKQTGHHYRLPTEAEWEYAYQKGGGSLTEPMTPAQASVQARWQSNSFDAASSRNTTLPVGSLAPNSLGIFDMAGNVAEWVSGTGTNRVIRGGHFLSPLTALGGLGREQEDSEAWNMNDPGDPKSAWWFTDAQWTGFRVVCEPPL